jgi:NADH:ubiquinone oxidoreductase subunit C
VEISELVTQTLNRIPNAVLEKSRFGRSEQNLFWLNGKQLLTSAQALRDQAGLDWLENLSAMQVDESLVFTYFVRKFEEAETTILRVSIDLASFGDEYVELQSVTSVWPMAKPFESEISRLFGVKIDGKDPVREWDGFPLRKNFVMSGGLSL